LSITSNDISNITTAHYTQLESTSSSIIIAADMTHAFDNSITNDNNIQLVSQLINQANLYENMITEDGEEP